MKISAVATQSIKSEKEDQLSFNEGENLCIMSFNNGQKWWTASLRGKIGLVPWTAVRILPPKPPPTSPLPPITESTEDQAAKNLQRPLNIKTKQPYKARQDLPNDSCSDSNETLTLDKQQPLSPTKKEAAISFAELSEHQSPRPINDSYHPLSPSSFVQSTLRRSISLKDKMTSSFHLQENKAHSKRSFLLLKLTDGIDYRGSYQKYWCSFDGRRFRYFGDIVEAEAEGAIATEDIVHLKHIASEDLYGLSIELKLRSGKVCIISSERQQDVEDWFTLLSNHTSFSKVPPEEVSESKSSSKGSSGATSCVNSRSSIMVAEKRGWLKKQGHNMTRDWKRRYVVLRRGKVFYYKSLENYFLSKEIKNIDLMTGNARHDLTNVNRFDIITPSKTYSFQAETGEDAKGWVQALQEQIGWSIGQVRSRSTSDYAENQKKDAIQLRDGMESPSFTLHPQHMLVGKPAFDFVRKENPSNCFCADCQTPDPEWASINLGIVICIACSGVHRSLGVHLSKVRSLILDDWDVQTLSLLKNYGNENSNTIYLATLEKKQGKSLQPSSSREDRETFIRLKYSEKQFLPEQPLANSVLIPLNYCSSYSADPVALSYGLLQISRCQENQNHREVVLQAADLIARGADPNFNFDPAMDLNYLLTHRIISHTGIEANDISEYQFPLHAAAASGNSSLVEMLIQSGADPCAEDDDSLRADDYAEDYGHIELTKYLQRLNSKQVRLGRKPAKEHHGTLAEAEDALQKNSECDLLENSVHQTGWLYKQPRQGSPKDAGKDWSRRWCTLEWDARLSNQYQSAIRLYKSSQVQSKDPSGSILVDDMLEVKCVDEKHVPINAPTEHLFELHTWSHIFVFATATAEEQRKWITAIQTILQYKACKWALRKKSQRVREGGVRSTKLQQATSLANKSSNKVFGVSLEQLAFRRQGSRDKGVPLFISKLLGFFEQVASSNVIPKALYEGDVPGIHRSKIHSLVKTLKLSFDRNDETVDLQSEYNRWKSDLSQRAKFGAAPSVALGFMRATIILMSHYFTNAPAPLISNEVHEILSDAVSHIQSDLRSDELNCMSLKNINSEAIRLWLQPALKELPESHWQTLKKLVMHMRKTSKCSSDTTSATQNQRFVAAFWAPVLFGITNRGPPSNSNEAVKLKSCQMLIELLIEHHEVAFEKEPSAKNRVLGSLSSQRIINSVETDGSSSSTHVSPALKPAGLLRVQVDIEVLNLTTTWSKLMSESTTLTELCQMLRREVEENQKIQQIPVNVSFYALFEVLESGWIRQLEVTNSKSIQDVVKKCKNGKCKIAFRFSPFQKFVVRYTNKMEQNPNEVLMQGYLFKEGVSVKSWKNRFFQLRLDGLYYFRSEAQTGQENLLGKLSYSQTGLYAQIGSVNDFLVPPYSSLDDDDPINHKAPTPFRICLRQANKSGACRFICAPTEDKLYEWMAWLIIAQSRERNKLSFVAPNNFSNKVEPSFFSPTFTDSFSLSDFRNSEVMTSPHSPTLNVPVSVDVKCAPLSASSIQLPSSPPPETPLFLKSQGLSTLSISEPSHVGYGVPNNHSLSHKLR